MTASAATYDLLKPWRAEAKATILLAYPLILTNLAQALIHATDLVLLGWVGPETLAAGALGVNIFTAFLIFGMGLVTAAAPIMARELGARSNSVRDVRRTVRQAMWAAIAISVPFWAVLWNSEGILLLLGQDPALSAEAGRFVRALQWGLLPYLFFLILRSFVSTLDRPVWSLVVGGVAVVVNGLLNYVLIFGKLGLPALGLLGAGIGSCISNFLMFAGMAAVVMIHPRFRRYRLFGRFWRPDAQRFREVWSLGLPIAITVTLEVTVFNAAVFLMGLLDTASLAAHAIAIQIAALTFMVPLGLSQAVTIRVGRFYGRRDPAGMAVAGWTSFVMGTGFMAAMAAVMIAFPRPLVGLFLDPGDPANAPVIALAISFLGVAAVFQVFDGAQAVGAGMLRGLHDTTVPMIYAAVGYWVIGIGVGTGLAFGLGWRGIGIWIGLASGLAVVSVLMIGRWMRRERLQLTSW
ncbi:MAG TPA: MATE family efflux transporter [Allosphingosinicella sp.]|nr:MATE family efflux transporter [Allosphingosinicella sp.]